MFCPVHQVRRGETVEENLLFVEIGIGGEDPILVVIYNPLRIRIPSINNGVGREFISVCNRV
jgi:hypothetical protein